MQYAGGIEVRMTATESTYRLTDRYALDVGHVFCTGVQALARLPLEQLRADRANGLNTAAFISGYQGSPLGGYDRELAAAIRTTDLPIVLQPAVNEELGATAVMGSQLAAARPDCRYDGVLGLWYGKAPGLDRACDALRHAVFAGTSRHGGAVALVGDDPAAKSSTLPSSSDATLLDLHMPLLYPGDVAEVLELGRHAIALSRVSGMWTGLKIVAAVADGSGTVRLGTHDFTTHFPEDAVANHRLPDGMLMTPHTLELEREFREVRTPLVISYAEANDLNRITVNPATAWIGLVASGFTYHEMLEALRRVGLQTHQQIEDAGIRILQMRMPIPFGPNIVREFASGLEEIVVIEEKNPTLEWLIKDALYGSANQPRVVGKVDDRGQTLMRSWGQLDADAIINGLRSRLSDRLETQLAPPTTAPDHTADSSSVHTAVNGADSAIGRPERKLIEVNAKRTPAYCSGCPHNWGTQAPDGALVGAGIGCHIMSVFMDEDRVGEIAGITAMGNEGAQWVGLSPFVDTNHFIQNLGDGTFFHSGQLAVQQGIAAGVNMTFKLLVNNAVAMTGGQQPQGEVSVTEIVNIAIGHGVRQVIVTTEDLERYSESTLRDGPAGTTEVWDRTRIIEAQEALAKTAGVTLLIHDQACAAETRRNRKRGTVPKPTFRVVINPRICEGCGDCGAVSNCLSLHSIDTPFGPKTTIDQTSCNLDSSCIEGDCPSFARITIDPNATAQHQREPDWNHAEPEDPPVATLSGEFSIRMAGIGGTGVVTAAQVIGTAAMLSGLHVRGNDQTGLSQKAGPVISDLRIGAEAAPQSNMVGAEMADLLLGFDLLVATESSTLAATRTDHTLLVGSTSFVPTAQMVGHPEEPPPSVDSLLNRARSSISTKRTTLVDVSAIIGSIAGDTTTSNTFLIGVAAQQGALPMPVSALEQAIELNGVAVEANLAAFRWGRRWVTAPAVVEELAGIREAIELTVPHLIDFYATDLVGYQNQRYAAEYRRHLSPVLDAERTVFGEVGEVSRQAAQSLHQLMAYKDEYEVARLLLDSTATEGFSDVAPTGSPVTWMLHPPLLASLGRDHKLRVPKKIGRPAMAALRRSRGLRGTKLDPFARTEVRRTERELISLYIDALSELVRGMTPDRRAWALSVAVAPQQVRGYERLKLERAATFRTELAKLLDERPPTSSV